MTAPTFARTQLLFTLLPVLFAVPAAWGADGPFKLTVGEYLYSDGSSGQDANLRWRRDDNSVWVGGYRDPAFGSQARIGADGAIDLGDAVQLQPSLQAATRGFLGGSVNVQVGKPYYAVIGWGRTNLRPYMNLNFDPNDAVTAGIGWQGEDGRTVSLTVIADDRLHTGQKDWHLYTRWPLPSEWRATVDVMRKLGQGDEGPVHAWGCSVTVDAPSWFFRLARDPKQNFSALDATRLSAGIRF